VFIRGSHERIQLFRGTIGQPCDLRRYVIAVKMDSWMHFKSKLGQKGSKNVDLEHCCYFQADIHG
jgi:hypothetical protein